MPVKTEELTERKEAELVVASADEAAAEIDEPQDTVSDPTCGDAEDLSTADEAPDDHAESDDEAKRPAGKRRIKWSSIFAFGVLPVLVLLLGAAAGFLKWQGSQANSQVAAIESVAAARDSTVALLSYQPDSVEKDLGSAAGRLTGTFKESYLQLTHDVVIPGAKKQHIAAIATVPAAASVSATTQHAVVLVFVNQTVTVGSDVPSDTASTVRVTMDKQGDRWLVSAFDPV